MKKGLMKEHDMKPHERTVSTSIGRRLLIILVVAALLVLPAQARAAGGTGQQIVSYSGLTSTQQATLLGIARDSWKFYSTDLDPNTHLPLDNVTFAGGWSTPTSYGRYTSAANVGLYMWAVVAATDLGLISHAQAVAQLTPTLQELHNLTRYRGFLYQWYDTTTGDIIRNPGDIDCKMETTPTRDNCYFVSAVDNGLYAAGLVVAQNALPELATQIHSLMAPMDFGIFYDSGSEDPTSCVFNSAGQSTGQQYGGYYVFQGPAGYHNGALYSDPRISMYMGMGLHQMPGNVWWRSWRVLPEYLCAPPPPNTTPSNYFSWQGQFPYDGYWQTYKDPQSGQLFPVWEGHYTYPGTKLNYIPTFAGGMFEGLMVNEVVPETSWGSHSFGLADLRTAQVQIKYATDRSPSGLGYPVWGMSPSSTADDTGNYSGYGAEGLLFPYYGFGADASHPNKQLAQCNPPGCTNEDVVTPHASFLALDVVPQQAYSNIQALRRLYTGVYGSHGFYDAVNPTTGSVGHRILVLDQSMIMAALDNALMNRALQRHFAADPVSWAAQTYLSMETMSIH
jgi:hypothetical protein